MSLCPLCLCGEKMSGPDYIELRAHSAYSLLRGTSPPEALVAEAARLGLRGLALTDHNNVYGAVSFQKTAQALGIQPILGAEITIEPPPPNKALESWREGDAITRGLIFDCERCSVYATHWVALTDLLEKLNMRGA